MEKIFFSKLVKNGGENVEKKSLLYIKSKWSEMALEVIIYCSDTDETFKGELSAAQISQPAEELGIPQERFYDECQEAITAKMIVNKFIYSLKDCVFKLIKKETFETTLLEIPLKKLSSPLQILESAFEEIENLKAENNAKATMTQNDEISTQETLETLRNCLNEKEKMEKIMLRKFLMLLNTKKKEISNLKDQLEARVNQNQNQNEAAPVLEPDEFDADTQPFSDESMTD